MQRFTGLLILAGLLVLATHESQARWYNRGYGGRVAVGTGVGLRGWGYGSGYGYGGYGYGGGTAAGNYMQGMSQVIRAQGEYNESTSRAMINYEQARSKYIDNRKQWTDTYFKMKEQNQAQQAQKHEREKISQSSLDQAARAAAPKRLSAESVDPLTGKIAWPEILLGDEYAKSRTELEHLFELRAKTGHAVSGSVKIQAATNEMISRLKGNIESLPANEFISARKFLDSLAYTASRA